MVKLLWRNLYHGFCNSAKVTNRHSIGKQATTYRCYGSERIGLRSQCRRKLGETIFQTIDQSLGIIDAEQIGCGSLEIIVLR